MLTLKNLIKKIENKIDFPDGKNILYTSSGYTNKYIKLFDVNMKTVFKTATIIFKITSTQQYDFDDIVNRRNTNCGRWDTMDKKYGTRDMIHLGVADMDLKE